MRLTRWIPVGAFLLLGACVDISSAGTVSDTSKDAVRPASPAHGTSLAFHSPGSIESDPNILANAIPTITLNIGQSYEGTTPMGMGFHPGFNQYYGATGGHPSFSGFVWNAAGSLLQTLTPINVDVRGVNYNPNTDAIEVVSYAAAFGFEGLFIMGLDGTGRYTGVNTNVLSSLPGLASDQTVPAYDPARNRLYSRSQDANVNVVDRSTGGLTGNIFLDLSPAGFPPLLGETIGYDGQFDVLITVDRLNYRALVHRLDGSYVGACALPPFAPTQDRFNMGYSNGQLFLFDVPSNSWHGYYLFSPSPIVDVPETVSGPEGAPIVFNVTASDPDGPNIESFTADLHELPVGNNATFTVNGSNTQGVFSWTPTYQDSRSTPYPVTFTATNTLVGSATTGITVTNINRPPSAHAGGPYTAFVGAPVAFDGTGSSDPDGDPLTFAWVFGDGNKGSGAMPFHTYAAIGVYGVALTVSDGTVSALTTTTANIVGLFQARAFTSSGNRSIRLSSGKPQWCVNLEPIGGSFSILTVDLSSVVLKSSNTGSVEEIHAIGDKGAGVTDHDGNGIDEITPCFRAEDLHLLFGDLRGKTSVPVTLEGHPITGGLFRAQLDVFVNAGNGELTASVSPNPLNPVGTLRFTTTRTGSCRIRLYDLAGRSVRTLMDEPSLAAGLHEVAMDGRFGDGSTLASGIYYFRIEAAEAVGHGRFTILK